MRSLSVIFAAALGLSSNCMAHPDVNTCDGKTFYRWCQSVVSEGNRQYDLSYRQGISLMADSLEHMLAARSAAGLLPAEDSLEFTADLLKLRADWHYENSNYDDKSYQQAEQLFAQVQDIYATYFENDKYDLRKSAMIHREQAQLYYKMQNYQQAKAHVVDAIQLYESAMEQQFFDEDLASEDYCTYLELQSQLALCNARLGLPDEAIAQIDAIVKKYPQSSEGYYELLRKKGKILMLSGRDKASKDALPLYQQYLAWRKTDAFDHLGQMTADQRQDYWMRLRPFVADCYQLEDADPSFLYDVTLFSKGLLLQLNRMSGYGKASDQAVASLQYTWQQIQQKLPADACAIEFIQYERGGKQQMGALVLTLNAAPKWVSMMAPDDFMGYKIGAWKNSERLATTEGSRKNAMYTNSDLCSKIWNQELIAAIGAATKVYFAPDGYFHQIAIEYMLPESISDVNVFRLTSTRRLMEDANVRTDAALIVGGVRYDAREVDSSEGNDKMAYSYMQNIHANFEYLSGSLVESNYVYESRSCPNDTLLVGQQATEFAFRTLCSQYPILNISTHGYFGSATIPQSTDLKTSLADESLSQCVIAMAGANPNIASENFNTEQMDGLLSARELSDCDLSNVDLAVISACQTGLGFITADGVFGIQRGLKNAGVKSLLVSLWNVDDKATCQLMSQFHQNLHNGMTVHAAFMSARDSLLGTDGDDDGYNEPKYRNAFILIDATE